MKKAVIVFVIVLGVAVVGVMLSNTSREPSKPAQNRAARSENVMPHAQTARVPAHFADAKSAQPLGPTLNPEQFVGKARRAYEIAKEIPETLAQLPCYCYCDQGFGHKSLHTCYESDHSAHCVTCVDEALMAYQLQKEQKLSPAKIREKIIDQFSRQ